MGGNGALRERKKTGDLLGGKVGLEKGAYPDFCGTDRRELPGELRHEVAVYLFEKLLKLLPVLLQIQVLAHLAKQCTQKRGPVAVAGQQVL